MKRVFLSLILVLTSSILATDPTADTSPAQAIHDVIELESSQILYNAMHGKQDAEAIKIYNERGISYFFNGDYDKALNDFNHVIEAWKRGENVHETIVGAAWWGRMFSHAYLGQEEEVVFDIQAVQYFFYFDQNCCQDASFFLSRLSNTRASNRLPIITIEAWPENEPMTKWECVQTVKNTAWAMMVLADKIPQYSVRVLVMKIVDDLKDSAMDCCYRGGLWSACIKPLADKLHMWNQKWKMFGIPPDPAWD